MRTRNATNGTARTVTPLHLALPPPHLVSDLMDAGRRVGWMSDETIGFRGFADAEEAMAASWMAYRTLARHLARRSGTRLVPVAVEPLTLARTGDRESILAVGRPIATLLRPGDDSRSGPDSFGFEIPVPPHDAERMHAMASLLHRTLRRSGIRWEMWRTDARGAAPSERPPRRERRTAGPTPAAPAGRRVASHVGASAIRVALIASIVVIVALAMRPFAETQPITIPVAVVVVAGLGAAAVGELNRRWQPGRASAARRAHGANGCGRANPSPRRA